MACFNENDAIVKCLIKHGADINKVNKNGETPLFWACYSRHEVIVIYLVENGAEIIIKIYNSLRIIFYNNNNISFNN